jgi:uncharacterized oligopeptide transporter (OPT) family protein
MILEANMSQTIGSASSSLASGTIFTIPALFLWGVIPPYWQVVALAFLGAILGITAMIPLRRLLIVKSADELPYPEGTACAEVLRATTIESSGGRWIFIGIAVGVASFALCALLAGLPGLAFAVGLYLPVGSLTPIFVGGLVRRFVDARNKGGAREGDPGVLAASGMIAGEGLAGVLIAFLVAGKRFRPESGWSQWLESWHFAADDYTYLTGPAGVVLGIGIVLAVSALLYRAGRSTPAEPPAA